MHSRFFYFLLLILAVFFIAIQILPGKEEILITGEVVKPPADMNGLWYLHGEHPTLNQTFSAHVYPGDKPAYLGNAHDVGKINSTPPLHTDSGKHARMCDGWAQFYFDEKTETTTHVEEIYYHLWLGPSGKDMNSNPFVGFNDGDTSFCKSSGFPRCNCVGYDSPHFGPCMDNRTNPYNKIAKQYPRMHSLMILNHTPKKSISTKESDYFSVKYQDEFPSILSSYHQPSFIIINPSKNFPRDKDQDLDGITNHDELYVHYTNPALSDTDRDGLSDSTEISLKLDPTYYDSDFDLLPDGTDPQPLVPNYKKVSQITISNPSSCKDEQYLVNNGNITIQSDYQVDNCMFILNCSKRNSCGIFVSPAGNLTLLNSQVRPYDVHKPFQFELRGPTKINNSEIKFMMGEKFYDDFCRGPDCHSEGGILINNSEVIIENSLIIPYNAEFLSIHNSSPRIRNNRFLNNYGGYSRGRAIFCKDCNASIHDNTFSLTYNYDYKKEALSLFSHLEGIERSFHFDLPRHEPEIICKRNSYLKQSNNTFYGGHRSYFQGCNISNAPDGIFAERSGSKGKFFYSDPDKSTFSFQLQYRVLLSLGKGPFNLPDNRKIDLTQDILFDASLTNPKAVNMPANAPSLYQETLEWNIPTIIPKKTKVYYAFITINQSANYPESIVSISNTKHFTV